MTFKYSINPVSKDYFFLNSTERALIERSLMDWHLQDYVQKLITPERSLIEVANNVILIESMNDVELIESLAHAEELTFGGEWQSRNPEEGNMILAIRPEIFDLFKKERTKNTEQFFKEQNWNYKGQFVKKMIF